jgi:hypothetical protein
MKNYQLLIQDISRLIDQAEISKNPYDFIEARRKLNNDLVQAIDEYVEQERKAAVNGAVAIISHAVTGVMLTAEA